MPTISMFYGIISSLFFEIREKHHSPRIHAGNIGIDPQTLYALSVPVDTPRA